MEFGAEFLHTQVSGESELPFSGACRSSWLNKRPIDWLNYSPRALRPHVFKVSGPKDNIMCGFWAILSRRVEFWKGLRRTFQLRSPYMPSVQNSLAAPVPYSRFLGSKYYRPRQCTGTQKQQLIIQVTGLLWIYACGFRDFAASPRPQALLATLARPRSPSE